eukprot:3686281-Rhodomonas_salina.1
MSREKDMFRLYQNIVHRLRERERLPRELDSLGVGAQGLAAVLGDGFAHSGVEQDQGRDSLDLEFLREVCLDITLVEGQSKPGLLHMVFCQVLFVLIGGHKDDFKRLAIRADLVVRLASLGVKPRQGGHQCAEKESPITPSLGRSETASAPSCLRSCVSFPRRDSMVSCRLASGDAWHGAKSNTRNRIPGTNCTAIAVSEIPGPGVVCRGMPAVHPEIKYKKPHFQYIFKLYQEC